MSVAGRYVVGALLGSGGVAQVHRARDLLLERDVAIKLFGPGIDPSGPERERAEMRLLANLTHPHLVTVFDAGTDHEQTPPRAFLVMALVDGPSLGDLLRKGPLDPGTAQRVGSHIADALAYVHSRDVIHRDVKPANILLDGSGTAFLADFGVAQAIGAQALTATGTTVGTAAFLSPEQVRGRAVTAATDVYALGLVLLESLTGEREYSGSSAETALARLTRPPRIRGRVPEAWEELLVAMTSTEPDDRPTATHVASALRSAAMASDATSVLSSSEPTQAIPDTGAPDATRRLSVPVGPLDPAAREPGRRTHRWALAGAAAAVALVLLIAAVVLTSTSSNDRPVPDPPAGAPGPARLDADLQRLSGLVQP